MKKIFCCPALELFHCLPLWKTVLFVSSRALSLSTLTFSLSTPVDNSEATLKKATKCTNTILYHLLLLPQFEKRRGQAVTSFLKLLTSIYRFVSCTNFQILAVQHWKIIALFVHAQVICSTPQFVTYPRLKTSSSCSIVRDLKNQQSAGGCLSKYHCAKVAMPGRISQAGPARWVWIKPIFKTP